METILESFMTEDPSVWNVLVTWQEVICIHCGNTSSHQSVNVWPKCWFCCANSMNVDYERKFNQRWSRIPSISTIRTITSRLESQMYIWFPLLLSEKLEEIYNFLFNQYLILRRGKNALVWWNLSKIEPSSAFVFGIDRCLVYKG